MSNYSLSTFLESDDISSLNKIIDSTNEKMEGNILYRHHSNYCLHGKNKEDARYNLYHLSEISSKLVEIGFNGGHSEALFFYANPDISLLSFDLCDHRYTELCLNYLQSKYRIEFIKGNSIQTIPQYRNHSKYNVIHIDGGHGKNICYHDMLNCRMFGDEHSFLVVDDSYLQGIGEAITEHESTNFIYEIDYEKFCLFKTNQHRIFKYVM
jgi:hypothetical protein